MKKLTPLRAIRQKCLDCSETVREVRECAIQDCSLYPYRLGKNPKRKGIGNLKAVFSQKARTQ